MTRGLLSADVATFDRHPLHSDERDWTETNCYLDIWVELLHALGHDPHPANACALSSGFDGEQWTFLKYPARDLRDLYGLDVAEINVWRPVEEHIEEHLSLGHQVTVEVDSYYLPDTAGVSYRREHTKTTVVPVTIDRSRRSMSYLHGTGAYELSDSDYDGIFGERPDGHVTLPPYMESVRPVACAAATDHLDVAIDVARRHLSDVERSNPVRAMGQRIEADAPRLCDEGMGAFHAYAFGTLRQCGAAAELAASWCRWMERNGVSDLGCAEAAFRDVSAGMKSVQLQLARSVRRGEFTLPSQYEQLADAWCRAIQHVAAACGV